jgi:SAM-dependent methyltransferase
MRVEHMQHLCCPKCQCGLEYVESLEEGEERHTLQCNGERHCYPVINGIPRFVRPDNYAASFGFQWNTFSKVQLDSYNGSCFSEQRFRSITGWSERDLAGKLVLDAGCGAGRFAEVALGKYKAELVACDLSEAVDACRQNLLPNRPLICQASIYDLPFQEGTFDVVYCIGVVQHTPDPADAIRRLCKLVKPGGQIALWVYELNWKSFVGTTAFKYALRPITTRLPRRAQVALCKTMVDLFHPIVRVSKHLGLPGQIIMRLLPVPSAYLQAVNLRYADLKSWLFLDTFDMYSPTYDKPQRFSSIVRLLTEQGFESIQRHPHGAIAVTAKRRS